MKKAAKPVLERLMLRQFGGRTRTGRVGLLHRAEHVMKCGLVDEPLWLSAVRECAPRRINAPPSPFPRSLASLSLVKVAAARPPAAQRPPA